MLESIYFFIIGAFIGWVLECMFKYASKNFRHTPGILNTPFCILYGLGTVVLSLVINRITNNYILLFTLSMIVLTLMEYVTFVLLKKIYGLQLWDYSDMKFNINAKVCLEFSLIWGVLGATYIKFILPILSRFLYASYSGILPSFIYLIFGIIFVDFIYSSVKLTKNKRLEIKQ